MGLTSSTTISSPPSMPGGGGVQSSDVTFQYPTTYPFVLGDIGKLIGRDSDTECSPYAKDFFAGAQGAIGYSPFNRFVNNQGEIYIQFSGTQVTDGVQLFFYSPMPAFTITFKTVVTIPTTQVLIGVDWDATFANLITFINTYFSATNIFDLTSSGGNYFIGKVGTDIAIGNLSNNFTIDCSIPGIIDSVDPSNGGVDGTTIELYDAISTNTYTIDTADAPPAFDPVQDAINIVNFINTDPVISLVFSATEDGGGNMIITYVAASSIVNNNSALYANFGYGLQLSGYFDGGLSSGDYPIRSILGKLVSFSGLFATIKMYGIDTFELTNSADYNTNKFIRGDDDGKIQALDNTQNNIFISVATQGFVGYALKSGTASQEIPVRILSY